MTFGYVRKYVKEYNRKYNRKFVNYDETDDPSGIFDKAVHVNYSLCKSHLN